jgi:hypothetical protein
MIPVRFAALTRASLRTVAQFTLFPSRSCIMSRVVPTIALGSKSAGVMRRKCIDSRPFLVRTPRSIAYGSSAARASARDCTAHPRISICCAQSGSSPGRVTMPPILAKSFPNGILAREQRPVRVPMPAGSSKLFAHHDRRRSLRSRSRSINS